MTKTSIEGQFIITNRTSQCDGVYYNDIDDAINDKNNSS